MVTDDVRVEAILLNLFLLGTLFGTSVLTACVVRLYRRLQHGGTEKSSRLQLVVGNLLVFFWLCSILVSGGEIYYRFFVDTTDSFGLTLLTQRWFSRHFHRNLTGFRDSLPVYNLKRAPGVPRISFLGDSFTAGHGVDDVEKRFANIIRSKLAGSEVHVLSECGWDTAAELDVARHFEKFGYEPDLVVLVYCLNDLADISPDWQRALERIYRESPGLLVESSYFINTLYNRWRAAGDPDVQNYYHSLLDDYDGPVWHQQQQRLRELKLVIEDAGGRLVVVIFPFLNAVEGEYPYRAIHDKIGEFWSRESVPHIDLLASFDPIPPHKLMVNRNDAHPNPFAHQIAADAILKFLQDHSLQTQTGP